MTAGLRFTSADLETMPDIPGIRYEIIDGELYVSRQPSLGHQYASGELHYTLQSWSKDSDAGFVFATPGLVFADDQDVIPDLVWISRGRLAEARDALGHLRLAPELVVEVLSPGRVNEVRDREIKLSLYSRRGVLEYWIVDWLRRSVEVFRRGADALEPAATFVDGGTLTSPMLPGFNFPVSSLWTAATS